VRPTTRTPGFDSAGPAIWDGHVTAFPVGDSLDTMEGAIKVKGSMRSRSGDVVAPLRAKYVVTDCGVELQFAAYPGKTYEYSSFFRGNDLPKLDDKGSSLTDGDTRVTWTPQPKDIALQRGYGSSNDPRLVRARLRFRVSKARTIHVTQC
jgi:hypothetical protein